MESLYLQTNSKIQDIQDAIQLLLGSALDSDTTELEQLICTDIDTVLRNCDRLDILVQKQPSRKRSRNKIYADQLRYDIKQLQNGLHEKYSKMQRRRREYVLSGHYYTRAIFDDRSIDHHSYLRHANIGIDELITSGAGILENLPNQRGTLKRAQRRLMDIANTLGLSNTTMRMIEKRARENKFLFYGGIIVTLIFITLVIWYLA